MHLFNIFYPWNTLRCIRSKNFAYVNEMMLLYGTIDNKVIPPMLNAFAHIRVFGIERFFGLKFVYGFQDTTK